MRIASVSGLRGIVGDGLDPACLAEFAAAYAAEAPSGTIIVGHDGRATAPALLPAVVAGLVGCGRLVQVVGPIATPTLGVLVAHTGAAGGVQLSASHNPPEYNGLKFFQPGGMVLGPAQGRAVVDRYERREFPWARWDKVGRAVEAAEGADDPHLERVLAVVDRPAIAARRFRVVLDACHGSGGRAGAKLLRALGCEVRLLGGEPDGLYDHPPEPTAENLSELGKLIPAAGAAIGFAQDPDADRLAILDESGRYLGEELTLALAVRHRLEQEVGPVVMNLSTSRVAEDLAKAAGATVERTPVGEIHVVERLRQINALIGGEGNGGVIDPRVGFVRDSLVAMALVLDRMAATGRPVSALADELPQYAMVKTKFPLGAAGGAPFDRIASAFPEAKTDRRDGLRLDWPGRWAHVRASNTEPIVRVIAEAADLRSARELAEAVGRYVG